MDNNKAAKLNIDIPRHQLEALQELIPYGDRADVFIPIIQDLIELLAACPSHEERFRTVAFLKARTHRLRLTDFAQVNDN